MRIRGEIFHCFGENGSDAFNGDDGFIFVSFLFQRRITLGTFAAGYIYASHR